jgi:hypothetical protein
MLTTHSLIGRRMEKIFTPVNLHFAVSVEFFPATFKLVQNATGWLQNF